MNTPERLKPKAKASPKEILPPVPPMPTNQERASGSQDQPKYDNPESQQEPKGKRGRPSNNLSVKKEGNIKPERPKHDTEKDDNKTKTYWRTATRDYLVDQLSKHGWKWSKNTRGETYKNYPKRIGTNYDRPTWYLGD